MEEARKPFFLPHVIPRCLKQMTQSPPVCLLRDWDFQATKILREHAQKSGSSSHSITQASNLASGLSDVIVILERPRIVESHSPNQSFDDFVNGSDTLQVVDELLRFASRGTRNIGTVTVINAFSLQPEKNAEADLRCEGILARFLQVKRPQVIIHCTNSVYKSSWMSRFNFGGKPYKIRSEQIEIVEGHTAIVIPSFHPSHAVNYLKYRLELRVLLMYHFALAFHSLGDRTAIPCCAKRLQDLCLYKGERKEDKSPLSDWDLASCISDKVNKSYLHYGKDVVPLSMGVIADEGLSDKINRESDTFDSLSFWLSLLLEKPQKFELFGIASASFLLKRANTNLNPVYSRISSALLDLVTEQDHWFFKTEDTDVADLEEKFSAVSLHVDPQIFGVIDANRKACVSVEKTLGLVEHGQVIDFSVKTPPHYCAVVLQNVLLAKCLASSPRITISTALRMEALSKRCTVINETSRKQSEVEGQLPDTEIVFHIKRLLECLRKLRMELEAILE